MYRTRLLCCIFSTALTACAVGPDYVQPDLAFDPTWVAPVDTSAVDGVWWQSLNDPMLTELVDAAIANNLDLKQSEARLREARAYRDAASGQSLPQAGMGASVTRDRISENGQIPVGSIPGFDRDVTLYQAGFDASWEIDIWGHQARTVESATARAEAADEARLATLVQVIAEVVRSYVNLRSAQEQLISASADAQAQDDIAKLVNERYQVGESSRFDFLRADAQARSTRAALPGFDASAKAAANQLALLTSQPPEALADRLLAPATLPDTPVTIAAGLRADLLRRRPDVRAAERQLAAATADVGIATADLYPRLSLVGSVGQLSQSGSDFFSNSSNQFSIGPSFYWPILSGGSIRANIRAMDARTDAAAARYESEVLKALSDSETAINRFAAAQQTQQDRELARDQSAQALELARQRYTTGEDDLIVLLDTQSSYTLAEQQSIAAKAATLEAMASLYKALGGGWESVENTVAANLIP